MQWKHIPVLQDDVTYIAKDFAKKKNYDVNKLHRVLAHTHEDSARKTAAYYGWTVHGTMRVCEECAMAKIKAASTEKVTRTKASEKGERIFLDISSTRQPSMGGRHFWILVLDDRTGYHWSFFVKHKSDLSKHVECLVTHLKEYYKIHIRNVRCDDAGENKALQTYLSEKGHGVGFEYTGPNSPQFNGRVERKFATLWARVRATAFCAIGEDAELQNKLWSELARYTSIVDNLIVKAKESEPAHNQMFGSTNERANDLEEFGMMAIVALDPLNKMKAKLAQRGRACMYVGPALEHPTGTYRFLHLSTRAIVTSRHVVWLETTFHEWADMPKVKKDAEFINLEKRLSLPRPDASKTLSAIPTNVATRNQLVAPQNDRENLGITAPMPTRLIVEENDTENQRAGRNEPTGSKGNVPAW